MKNMTTERLCSEYGFTSAYLHTLRKAHPDFPQPAFVDNGKFRKKHAYCEDAVRAWFLAHPISRSWRFGPRGSRRKPEIPQKRKYTRRVVRLSFWRKIGRAISSLF